MERREEEFLEGSEKRSSLRKIWRVSKSAGKHLSNERTKGNDFWESELKRRRERKRRNPATLAMSSLDHNLSISNALTLDTSNPYWDGEATSTGKVIKVGPA